MRELVVWPEIVFDRSAIPVKVSIQKNPKVDNSIVPIGLVFVSIRIALMQLKETEGGKLRSSNGQQAQNIFQMYRILHIIYCIIMIIQYTRFTNR